MWDRENNTDDELDLVYKDTGARESMPPSQSDHQNLPEPTFTPVENETATSTNNPLRTTTRENDAQKSNRSRELNRTRSLWRAVTTIMIDNFSRNSRLVRIYLFRTNLTKH